MKYIYFVSAILFAFIIFSCTKTGANADKTAYEENTISVDHVAAVNPLRVIPDDVPQFVRNAAQNAPQEALVGIGTAKSASPSMSRTTATTRARADISRQLGTSVIRSDDGAETVTVSSANLAGVTVIEEDMDDEGNYWVVVMMKKDE